jgi:hypothetical protein
MADPQPEEVGQGEVGHGAAAERREATPTEELPVPFEGAGAGTAALSWGQRDLWQIMQRKQSWLPIGAVLPLPGGTTVDDAVADLRFVMGNYPSLRTRLRLDPGGPGQVVAASGEVTLEIVDAPDEADPADVAKQVQRRFYYGDHDFASDLPVRMAVVRHRGVLTHRIWIMCHLVTDGAGALVILSELASRDASGSHAALSALEQARWQVSPAGQRQCDAVMRYWEKVLRSVPARRFPDFSPTPGPRYWQGRSDSPAAHLAVRAIAARTGVEASSVLLAVFAVALARAVGVNPMVAQVVVGNRFRPGLASTVSPITQNGLCVIEVPDTTMDEMVARTRRRVMATYKNAYYDPARRDELIARINRERGEEVDLQCFLNDRRLVPRDPTGPPPTPGRIRAATAHGSFVWTHQQEQHHFDKLYVNLDDEPDTVAMTVLTDVHHVSPVAVEQFVREMEEVAVSAAIDPAARTLVPVGGGIR